MSRHKSVDAPILLAETSVYYVNLLRDWLSDLGFKDVYACSSADHAKLLVRDHRFSALIIDSKLEDGSGIQLARDIRHTGSGPNRMTPMIILDGKATRRRVSAARDGGASEYVCKPMSRNSFTEHFRIAMSDQRSFIKAQDYFGPDLRRRANSWDQNDRRRHKPKRVAIEDGLQDS